VPEATVYENDRSVTPKNEIGTAGHVPPVQRIAKSQGMETSPQEQFGQRVLAPNTTHVDVTLFGSENVGHK
jgi:hypothetical protein